MKDGKSCYIYHTKIHDLIFSKISLTQTIIKYSVRTKTQSNQPADDIVFHSV